jgi:hypothetical protein
MSRSKTRTRARGPVDGAPPQAQPIADPAEDTSWFFTAEWQAGEREADEQTRAGQLKTYDSVDDLLAALHAEAEA